MEINKFKKKNLRKIKKKIVMHVSLLLYGGPPTAQRVQDVYRGKEIILKIARDIFTGRIVRDVKPHENGSIPIMSTRAKIRTECLDCRTIL